MAHTGNEVSTLFLERGSHVSGPNLFCGSSDYFVETATVLLNTVSRKREKKRERELIYKIYKRLRNFIWRY